MLFYMYKDKKYTNSHSLKIFNE